ncbi:NCS1 family nucleobase:cation symporter-1 [Acidomonas methanolica]|uniref:Cytosine/purines uracil thiamine allantoin permease n=1 Tax=Acidomonas methanolica NBRC 104435 TaxID=1231351 RepID=A0A023D5H1_ACIMT|nr:NCS1 family nucleobase:cation symporter-1 [Acidomonas methanolica]MBU2653287.1 NCS1 family nucleobase:cation symporter-1 [Acidomonas methanolica]TCS32236.1 NCS1 family nucleobase:cation symporter-1 [Acidomonas methanolica]GAJ29041.1 cytosine/purines uracil thiamine allantoin permease [Acidomonas methanolica NBRC 104435]GBQ49932.1 cytosine/uracil/thiamine/allantoin permease [Acidomonas methanolica]GEK97671.1 putative allantoin permease [Acidomonas methanolica NBRC 104435]
MTTQPFLPDPSLYNEDLAPIPQEKRDWTWLNMATVWMGMVHNIVVYEAAAGLMAIGFSAWQCLEIVAVAYVVLFLAMGLNARAGTRYGIPFCVLIRSAFGPSGAQLPVILRGFCAIFWFSVQAYAATQAVDAIAGTIWPVWKTAAAGVLGMPLHRWGALVVVWLLHAWIMNHGVTRIRNFELIAGPLVIVIGALATVWALKVGHGPGPLFAVPGRLHGWNFALAFAGGVTGMIGMWATFAVNIPDLSRFVRSQRDQVIGQAIGLPVTALVFTPMAIITTSATVLLFGRAIWNPVDLLLTLDKPLVTVLGGGVIVLATLSVNVVANIMPACYDLINLSPEKLNFHRASFLVLGIGLLFAPWLWFSEAESIYRVLDIISGLLGPVTGIMLADYFILRARHLDVPDLYRRDGCYAASNGWNPAAIAAFLLGGFCANLGLVWPRAVWIGHLSWFVGLAVAAGLYLEFSRWTALGRKPRQV